MSQGTCCGKRSDHWHVLYSRRDMSVVGPPPSRMISCAMRKMRTVCLNTKHDFSRNSKTCVKREYGFQSAGSNMYSLYIHMWLPKWWQSPLLGMSGLCLQGWQDPLAESRAECPTNAERCRCALAPRQMKGRFEWGICEDNPCVLSRFLKKQTLNQWFKGTVEEVLMCYFGCTLVGVKSTIVECTRSIQASLAANV